MYNKGKRKERKSHQMDEKKLHKNLKWMTLGVLLVSIFIAVIGTSSNLYFEKIQRETAEEELKASTEVYKVQIQRQIKGYLNTLHTLANFMKIEEFRDKEFFFEEMRQFSKNNDFTSLYFIRDEQVFKITEDNYEVQNLREVKLEPEAIEVIEESWNGREGISDVFYDTYTKQNVMAFSVPIYVEEQVNGVLMVYEKLENIEEIMELASKSNQNGQLIIQMINEEGEFLIRSNNGIYKQKTDSIYHMDMKVLDEDVIRGVLKNKEQYYTTFHLSGKEYNIFFVPLEYHGWYLFCIEPTSAITHSITSMLNVTRVMFSTIFILGIILILYGYRAFRKNNIILMQLAYIDPLTGAYNITKFRKISEQIVGKTSSYQICILNIRKFQFLNEVFGEKEADSLLCYMAKIIEQQIHKEEYFCHDNADQFILLLKERSTEEIINMIHEIENKLGEFSDQYNQKYDISLYAGIGNFEGTKNQENYNRLFQNALVALKKARDASYNIVFYDERLQRDTQLKNKIESRMRKALKEEEFKVFLQAKTDLQTGKLIGAEALVRWIQKDGTMIYPDQFIPLFEQNGFCAELDLYMVEKVCQALRNWLAEGKELIPVSINQSKLLFYRSDYIERLCEITERYQIPPKQITLEILEGLAIENIELLNETLRRLHEKGFLVSLDDFGSGFSSLNSLGRLKIDELKIDRMFLLGIDDLVEEERERQKNIMRYIILLAKSMNIITVIEGVETKENEILMKEMGCDIGQGYYYCKPISIEEFECKYL